MSQHTEGWALAWPVLMVLLLSALLITIAVARGVWA